MTASRLLQHIESWGLKLRARKGQLVVQGRPTRSARMMIGAHKEALLSILAGVDVKLTSRQTAARLRSMGLCQIDTGDWTHPRGDDVADAILCGEIDFETATEMARVREVARLREGLALGGTLLHVPPPETPILRPGRYPGHFTYTERGF
jgi:hypothetical protein